MDKRIAWSAGIVLAVLIIAKTPLVFTLFALLILGMVPGTSFMIPAWVLLILNPLLCIAIVWAVRSHHLLTPIPVQPPVAAKTRTRKTTQRKKRNTVAAKRRTSRATV